MNNDEREYAILSNAVDTLSIVCSGDRLKIIDLLTDYLWDEEEAGNIKESSGKFEIYKDQLIYGVGYVSVSDKGINHIPILNVLKPSDDEEDYDE